MTIKPIILTLSPVFIIGILLGFWPFFFSPAPVPDVSLTDLKGQTITLKQLRGQPVLVTFWATDCPACIQEIPDLIRLYRDHHAQGLEIIAVSMYYDLPSHVVDMVAAKQIPYRVVLDLRAKIAQAFGSVRLTPTSFLISPDGLIIHQVTGLLDLTKLQSMIKSFQQG